METTIMKIKVPKYDENGIDLLWEEGFQINCSIYDDDTACLEANKEGFISLARHMLEMAQDSVPDSTQIHLDEHNFLEEGSSELIIVRRDNIQSN